jgi:quinol monooxygenase YgiN
MTPAAAELGAGQAGVLFMVFHYPTPEHRDALARGMREMAAYMTGQPGLIDVAPPWWDEQHQALVGISRWESEAAFRAAIQAPPTGTPDTVIPEGERQPRQRFYLTLPGDRSTSACRARNGR